MPEQSDLSSPQTGPSTDPGFKPNRNNQVKAIGIYAQDVINIGQFSILAGLRFDKFTTKQTPHQEESYTIEADEISPRLGLVYQFNDDVSALHHFRSFIPVTLGRRLYKKH